MRRDGTVPELLPDGKAQVTVRYRRGADGAPEAVAVERVVVSSQHRRGTDMAELRAAIVEHVVRAAIPAELLDDATLRSADFVLVNPTGRFEVGGPMGDAGLTGRKIIVDTYGGMARHGGGAFSGKDPTKVDRSAAYACRWVAKNIVAAGLARAALRAAGRLRDRRRAPGEPERRDVRDAPRRPGRDRELPCASTSTCGPRRSCATSTCGARSTAPRRPTATSAAIRKGFPWERTDRAEGLARALGVGAAHA